MKTILFALFCSFFAKSPPTDNRAMPPQLWAELDTAELFTDEFQMNGTFRGLDSNYIELSHAESMLTTIINQH